MYSFNTNRNINFTSYSTAPPPHHHFPFRPSTQQGHPISPVQHNLTPQNYHRVTREFTENQINNQKYIEEQENMHHRENFLQRESQSKAFSNVQPFIHPPQLLQHNQIKHSPFPQPFPSPHRIQNMSQVKTFSEKNLKKFDNSVTKEYHVSNEKISRGFPV